MRYRTVILIGLLWGGCVTTTFGQDPSEQPFWDREWMLPSGVTYQLRGRVDTDALAAVQSEKNVADFGELDSVVGLRRARIGLEGDLPNEGSYVGEIDLATGQVVIRDLFVAMPGLFDGQSQLGHFREPFSLEGGTSAKFFAFMERSPANVLDPARNWGMQLHKVQPTENSSWATGFFYGARDQNDFEGGPGSTVGVTTKLTAAPIYEQEGRYLLHFAAALAERLPLDNVIIVNEKPRSPLLTFGDSTNSPFVPKLVIPADFQHILNAQIALAHGSWWSQAEWYGTFIDQTDGSPVFYQGNHVDLGYFLTGEHREYDRSTGVFGAVRVNRPYLYGPSSRGRELGPGAWELTARFASIDFIDPSTPLSAAGQLQGVQMSQYTLGTNWYLTDHLRLMFNYTYALPTEPTLGQSSAHVFGTRLGLFW